MILKPTEEQLFEYWEKVEINGGALQHFLKAPTSRKKFSESEVEDAPILIYINEEYRDKEVQERFIKWKEKKSEINSSC